MTRPIGVVILWTLVWCVPGFSQELPQSSINASASKTSVLIAEPFTVRIEVLVLGGSEVEFPSVIGKEESTLGVFDVLATQTLKDIPLDRKPTETSNDGRRRWTRTLTLETLRVGQHTIPSMTAVVTHRGESRTLTSAPVEIAVSGVLKSQDEPLRDISGVIQPEQETPSINSNKSKWWMAASVAAATIIVGILGLRWWRKRQHPLRWCQHELLQLDEELQALCEAPYPINLVTWVKRLRIVLRTAVSTHRVGAMRLPSNKQLFGEIAAIKPTQSMSACEDLLRELDRVRFSTEAANLQSESSFAIATDALREAESLLSHLTSFSRSNQRGV